MKPDEALEYKKRGGKLYEPLDFDRKLTVPKEKVVIIYIPATNPYPEDGK